MHVEERNLRLPDAGCVFTRIWTPEARNAVHDAILFLHGVESHGAWFEEVCSPLVAEGFALYASDRPGWGASDGARGDLHSYAHALAVVEGLVAELRRRHARVHGAGLSWGGKLALYAAVRRPLLFDSLTLIVPGLYPRRDISLPHRARVAASLLLGRGGAYVPLPIRDQEFTRRADRLSFVATDPLRVRAVTARFCLENLKMGRFLEEHVVRLRTPAQLLLAGEDRVIDNAATDKLFSLAGSPHKRVEVCEGAAHSLVFEAPDRVARALASWPPAQARRTRADAPRHILVLGAGAVGSLVGGLLAWAGHRVTLVAREAHARAVNEQGLRLHMGGTRRTVREGLVAVTEPAAASEAPDLVLLCVKGFDTEAALQTLAPVLGPETPILSLQNGVRNEEIVARLLADRPIVAGAVCAYVALEGPGCVRLHDDRGGLALGPWTASARAATARAHAWLADTGLAVASAPEGKAVKWSKLMLNVAFNPLNALTGLGTRELLSHRVLGGLAVRAFAECARVMAAQDIAAVDLPGYPVSRLARLVRLPAGVARPILARAVRAEAQGASSMAADLARGRGRTEAQAINGAVVQAGRAHEVITPVNALLVSRVQEAVEDPARRDLYRRRPEAVAG